MQEIELEMNVNNFHKSFDELKKILQEHAFLKNKAAMFSSWSDFKESCSYNQQISFSKLLKH